MGDTPFFEKISLLYVRGVKTTDLFERFQSSGAWRIDLEPDPGAVYEKAKFVNPDVILFDSPVEPVDRLKELIAGLRRKGSGKSHCLLLVLNADPGVEQRLRFFNAGFDDVFVAPVSTREIVYKIQAHLQKNDQHQSIRILEEKQAGLLSRLQTLEKEIHDTEKELTDEKDMLNSALKQINQMNRERDRINTELAGLTEQFRENAAGFSRLLSRVIELNIETNRGHARRVADISIFAAGLLHVPAGDMHELETAAMLHEIGLLLFPGGGRFRSEKALTPAQKEHLVQYPVKGADLLNMCPGYARAAEIIRALNENADGTGFPDGLKCRNIPLLSRILAGADLLDSLYDQDPFLNTGQVMGILEETAGQRLDPLIVNCLEKYVISGKPGQDYAARGVGISDLKPGMRLAAGLFTATGTKLFSANTLLNEAAIDKIVKYNREYPVDETVYIRA